MLLYASIPIFHVYYLHQITYNVAGIQPKEKIKASVSGKKCLIVYVVLMILILCRYAACIFFSAVFTAV